MTTDNTKPVYWHTEIRNATGLTGVEKGVLQALASRGDNIFPSLETLAKDSAYGTATVKRTIKSLREKRWLEYEHQPGGSNHYSLSLAHSEPRVDQSELGVDQSELPTRITVSHPLDQSEPLSSKDKRKREVINGSTQASPAVNPREIRRTHAGSVSASLGDASEASTTQTPVAESPGIVTFSSGEVRAKYYLSATGKERFASNSKPRPKETTFYVTYEEHLKREEAA